MTLFLLLFAVIALILMTTKFKVHPFLALITVALGFGLLAGMPIETIITSIKDGFGGTIGSIGLVIIFGVIIGAFLEETGGAFTLARLVLRLVGESRLPIGMSLIGFIVSIPVFCDSGFVLLTPLNKALSKRVGISLVVTTVALAIGLMASHSMVPPTPGPIAAAGILGADIGTVILWGIIIGLLSMILPLLFAYRMGRKIHIDPAPDLTDDEIEMKINSGPPAWKALLPIGIPIVLILIASVNDFNAFLPEGMLTNVFTFLGHPIIALFIGMLCSFLLPEKWEASMMSDKGWTGKALRDAAIILMITGAGGIFGKILQNSDLPQIVSDSLGDWKLGIWLPFIIAAALKSAQGSSTVAMITTASIVAPLLTTLGLETSIEVALSVLAIGAGSAVVSHAPDSYFWVVTQMSGLDVSTGYRTHTIATGLMGGSAILMIWALSLIL